MKIFILPFLLLLLASCGDEESKIKLQEREQALLEKEKQFALKEADYQSLVQLRDSLQAIQKDTLPVFMPLPENVLGRWNSKIVCTESNCTDYVVGDQRMDIWEFAQDSSSKVLVKNINNNALIRVYTGTFDGAAIQLSFNTDSSAAKKVDMQVLLDDIKENKIRGKRTITVDGKCNARFNIELDRVKI